MLECGSIGSKLKTMIKGLVIGVQSDWCGFNLFIISEDGTPYMCLTKNDIKIKTVMNFKEDLLQSTLPYHHFDFNGNWVLDDCNYWNYYHEKSKIQ